MDIQSAAAQLMTALANNPELVSQFAQHPYSTTASVTGTNEHISKKDMSGILAQVAAQASGQTLGATDTKDLASALLGQSGGSVHGLANALFGSAKPQTSGNQTTSAGGVDLSGVLSSLASNATAPSAGGPSMAEIAAKSIAGAVAARGMAALITSAMNASKKDQQ